MPFKPPTVTSSGALMPFMSTQELRGLASRVFKALGGEERLILEANEDSDSYKWFIEKVFIKAFPRNVEVSATDSVDELIARIEAGERATVIEGEVINATEKECVEEGI